MMSTVARLPALPLAVSDPYFSYWMPADRLTDADCAHWSGAVKPLRAFCRVDGRMYRVLGRSEEAAMPTVSQSVTPTATRAAFEADGVRVTLRFTTPALLREPELFSVPAVYVDMDWEALDGKPHEVTLRFFASDALCYDGDARPAMFADGYARDGLPVMYTGQRAQKPLCHSGDHITIDWGYLYLAGEGAQVCEGGLQASGEALRLILAYDETASVNYFGSLARPYYAKDGKTLPEAISELWERRPAILARCEALDRELLEAANAVSPEYAQIVAAAYRHAVGAHKLVADGRGQMLFLSKENDSNGCIGTVDVNYPASPLFLLENPALVRAMCQPILEFASLPVWKFDFAPHDVGRYPYATGQVYGLAARGAKNGEAYPPYYLYPASADAYELRYQMPVEESANMLVMLAAATRADGDARLARMYENLLEKWVRYLLEYGEDPGEQLCTDDFAGHMARNVNLSAKAVMGVAAYAELRRAFGDEAGYEACFAKAKTMAASWLRRADAPGGSPLAFSGEGWSVKYNLAWDKVFGWNLFPKDFYRRETQSYLPRLNRYGLPLDSRATYLKSDWMLWAAALAEGDTRKALIAPAALFLEETSSRVAFSDWYDSKTGVFEHFIARSVQGGLFMPLLADRGL